ncbi:MAG TPA: CRTAC1 family protein [Gemmataceae bacterium]|nr:CRTAC1 family protein [Gemmataceae bacterium]
MTRKVLAFAFAFLAAGAAAYYISSFWFKRAAHKDGPTVGDVKGRQSVPVPAIKFTDVTAASGVSFLHVNGATGSKLLPETMGGGVAVFDYDGDDKPDILFVQSGLLPGHGSKDPPPTMALYHNEGGFKFRDVTREAGLDKPMYGMGVCVGDFDNDGRPDIFVSCVGKHHLFRNVDGKKFVEVTDASGLGGGPDLPWGVSREQFLAWKDPIPFGSSCTFVDYDGDGKLDLFVCHYIEWAPKIDLSVSATLAGVGRAYVPPIDFNGAQCKLYHNVGGGRFEDVTQSAGVEVFRAEGVTAGARNRPVGKCLGVIVCDPDDDGWPDLMVANDGTPNFFFHNRPDEKGGRKFVECGAALGVALPDDAKARGGMGIDYGQILPNVYAAIIANFANEPNTLLRLRPTPPNQPRDLFFTDTALTYGLTGPSRTPLKFGAFFFDCDLDGRLDLLTCNGHIEPEIEKTRAGDKYAQPAQLFWNTGLERPAFEPVTEATAGKDLFQPIVGRGSAYADLDGDGDLDVILCANNGPPHILRNDTDLKHHWLRLNLTGDGVHANRSAIGATVIVECDGKTLTRMVVGGRGYLSQSELPVTIGLGSSEKVERILVKWPGKDMMQETFEVPAVDHPLKLKQGEGRAVK